MVLHVRNSDRRIYAALDAHTELHRTAANRRQTILEATDFNKNVSRYSEKQTICVGLHLCFE